MKYTKDNPKLVRDFFDFEGMRFFTGFVKDDSNNIVCYLNGQYHREDGPAVEYINGNKHWYLNGERHRKDGPAIEWFNGDKDWYLNDKLHREDGPARENANGEKLWYLNYKYYGCNDDFTNESWIRFIRLELLK